MGTKKNKSFKQYIKDNSNNTDYAFGAELENYDRESVEKRRAVIKEIITLAETSENWKDASTKFYELLENFKEIPCSDPVELPKLNDELNEARQLFYDKRKEFYAKSEERFKENAVKKHEVLDKLAELHYTSENLRDIDMAIKALSDEFFNIGFVGKEENDSIFKKFNELKNNLRAERKNSLSDLKENFDEKRAKKKQIIAELAGLVNNENWKDATVKFNALCEEFKEIGFSGKEENDEISEAYKNAKTAFFNERQKFFDEVKANNLVHIEKRKELINEVKALYENESWKEASEKVKAISEEFFKVGFCGKDVNEALINEFKEVRDGFYALRQEYFDKINSSKNEKQLEFLNKLAGNKKDFIEKLRGFISNDNERLEDFKGRLLSVKPGDKAEEIIENYQNIIEDIKTRIANNKAKLKEVQDELFNVNKQINEIKDK